MNNFAATGNSKDDNIYENRAYGIQTVEHRENQASKDYDKRRQEEEDSWLSLCIACLMCR